MSQPNPPYPEQPWGPPTGSSGPGQPPTYRQPPPYHEPPTRPPYGQPPAAYPPRPGYAPTNQPGQPYGPQPQGQPYGPNPYRPAYQQPGYPPQSYPTQPYPTPATDPWVGDAGSAYGQTEVLLGPPERPKRRRTVVITMSVVLALLLTGGGIAFAAYWYGWGTTEPEAVLPGSSVAFARVDLSPGLGQQLALGNLAKKFPQQAGGGDVVNSAKQNLVREVLAPLDFDADIKPWLGDRIGAALWLPNGASNPCALIALASNDDGRAGAALARVPHSTHAFSKGYAIVSECQTSTAEGSADAAVSAASHESLSGHAAFADQLSSLPSGQAVVAWLDGAYINQIMKSTVIPAGSPNDFSKATAQLANLNVMAGIRVAGDGLELRVRTHSSSAGNDIAGHALSQLDSLPGGTVFGAALDLSAAKQLGEEIQQSFGNLPKDVFGGDNGKDATNAQRVIKDLLGSQVTLSLVNPKSPVFQVLVHTADATSAQDIVNAIGGQVSSANGAITASGNTVGVTSRGYDGGSGTLAGDKLYQSAMANPPDNVFLAAYVNVGDLAPAMNLNPEGAANLAPVKAVGLTMGADHDSSEMLVRVVIQ